MIQKIINEDFLHYIWKSKQFDVLNLRTTDGQEIEILDFGRHNHDAGPDFNLCKIKIDGTLWVGDVEIHIFAGDWDRHSHDCDPAYESVILHVVYEQDTTITSQDGLPIPCIELKDLIPKSIVQNYSNIIQNNNTIPCGNLIQRVDPLTITMWKERLIAERLEVKSIYIKSLLDQYTYDWEAVFYITLARYMGAKVNMVPMELIANKLSLLTIKKNLDNVAAVEALLYGVGGFLTSTVDDGYHTSLKKEYTFLMTKYDLHHIPLHTWKFSKMRPAGFPTIRLSFLAHILCKNPSLLSSFLHEHDVNQVKDNLKVSASTYWDNHYTFGKESSKKHTKRTSDAFIDILIINVIAPFMYLYSVEKDDPSYMERAVELLCKIKPEKNAIIRSWEDLGIQAPTAMDTQALIQLKKSYCHHKRCMSCNIGNKIVHMQA